MDDITASKVPKAAPGRRSAPALHNLITACLCFLPLMGGCSKSKEPPITGRRSDPPIFLQCAWKPGYRYHLRVEMDVIMEGAVPDPNETGLHRVSFAQDCMITATNTAKGSDVGLDMEILSVAMDRAKGSQVALSFDSEQGGEACDDYGYIPVLQGLVGGHLRFLLSPEGKMLRAAGINEWLARALSEAPGGPASPKLAVDRQAATNAPPPIGGPVRTNAAGKVLRQVSRPMMAAASNRRSTVSNTLRNFFSPDLFRQILEFGFLPPGPVRVGAEWKAQGDISVSGKGRFRFEGTSKFAGWQQRGQTNCARVEVRASHATAPNNAPAPTPPPKTPPKPDTLNATVWIDTQLTFPASALFDTQMALPDDMPNRKQGTNNVVIKALPKSLHQTFAITLVEANPIEAPNP